LVCLISIIMSPPPVASKNATGAKEETDEEGDEGTKGEPICVAILSIDPVIPEDVPGNPPKYHVDNPNNEGAEEGKTRDEGHEDSARTVVCSPAKAEENGETRETSSDWVQDESGGQAMNGTR